MEKQKIKAAIKYGSGSITNIAAVLGYSRQNLTRKINQGTLSETELKTIAAAIGAEFIPAAFQFKDGTKI